MVLVQITVAVLSHRVLLCSEVLVHFLKVQQKSCFYEVLKPHDITEFYKKVQLMATKTTSALCCGQSLADHWESNISENKDSYSELLASFFLPFRVSLLISIFHTAMNQIWMLLIVYNPS